MNNERGSAGSRESGGMLKTKTPSVPPPRPERTLSAAASRIRGCFSAVLISTSLSNSRRLAHLAVRRSGRRWSGQASPKSEMIIKYEGAIRNGVMEGQGLAKYDDDQVCVILR